MKVHHNTLCGRRVGYNSDTRVMMNFTGEGAVNF